MCGSAFRCIKLLKVNGFALRPPVFKERITYSFNLTSDGRFRVMYVGWYMISACWACWAAGHRFSADGKLSWRKNVDSVSRSLARRNKRQYSAICRKARAKIIAIPTRWRKTILYFLVLSPSSPKLRRNKKLIRDRRSHHVLIQIRFVIHSNIR